MQCCRWTTVCTASPPAPTLHPQPLLPSRFLTLPKANIWSQSLQRRPHGPGTRWCSHLGIAMVSSVDTNTDPTARMKTSVSGGTWASRQPRREPSSTAAIPGREGDAVRASGDPAVRRLGQLPQTHFQAQTCKTLPSRPEPGRAVRCRLRAGAAVTAPGHGQRCPGSRRSPQPPGAGGGAGPESCGASATLRLLCGGVERGRVRTAGAVPEARRGRRRGRRSAFGKGGTSVPSVPFGYANPPLPVSVFLLPSLVSDL